MTLYGIYGGSGFIGQYIEKYLKHKGLHYFLIQNRGTLDEISASLSSFNNMSKKYLKASIIYLSENSDISFAEDMGEDYISENITRLKAIADNTSASIIYASSAGVYGDQSSHQHKPSENITGFNIYSKSKLECESIVISNGGVVARLANVYGIGMSSKNVISDILNQVICSNIKSIQIKDGAPVRDFIHVKDVARCLVYMAKSNQKGIFNVASGESISIKQLVKKILEIAQLSNIKIVETNKSSAHSSILLDVSQTKKNYKWKSQIYFSEGLKNLIQYTSETCT
jgi:nucleoside-diphosphate-sugar epimerase